MSRLDDIKAYILARNTQYNQAFSNVSKPDGTDVIMNDDGGTYCGISDALGNYFYVREMKSATYTPEKYSGGRVQFYKVETKCRLVSVFHDGNDINILQILISDISHKGGIVTNADYEKTSVIKSETGKEPTNINLQKLSIISVDFNLIDNVSAKNCSLNPCNC